MTLARTLPVLMVLALVAAAGPGYAQTDAGNEAYERGDYATAFKLWLAQANDGDSSAQYNVGVMYQLGQGVQKDMSEAAHWYRLAAERGVREARVDLGTMYANGTGVTQNVIVAYILFDLAMTQGSTDSKTYRETLLKFMTPAQLAEAKRLAADAREGNLGAAIRDGEAALTKSAARAPASAGPRTYDRRTVRQIQHALQKLGYDPGPVDGRMGPSTERAVRSFQRDVGMAEDGKLSEQLIKNLQVSFRQPAAPTQPAMPRTGGCTSYADSGYDIDIVLDIPPPTLNEDLDTKTLTRVVAGETSGSILGLAAAQIGMSTQFEARFAPNGKNYCYWVDSVELTLTISRLDVFVSADYEPGSCEYNVIFDHEQEHVEVYQDVVRKYGQRFEFELTSLLIPKAHSPKLVRDRERAQNDTKDLFERLLTPIVKQLEKEINREQGKIDTVQEYRRLHRKCRNW